MLLLPPLRRYDQELDRLTKADAASVELLLALPNEELWEQRLEFAHAIPTGARLRSQAERRKCESDVRRLYPVYGEQHTLAQPSLGEDEQWPTN